MSEGIPKRWRLAYRAAGAQKLLAIGVYPEVGLKYAREAREAAKKILAGGGDPIAVKKHAKAERAIGSTNTFEAVAADLVEKKRLVAQRSVRPHRVVVTPQALDDDLGFRERVEDPAIEQLVSEPGVEALNEFVLPWAARRDVGGLGGNNSAPSYV